MAFVGGAGGAAIGWTAGEKFKAGGVLAGVGLVGGIVAAHLLNTRVLEPEKPLAGVRGLGGVPDPFETTPAWYYVDSWVWFVGGWTPQKSKGPFWATSFVATNEEDAQAFDAKQLNPKYLIVRRFRWTGSGWVREDLRGDWARKYSV